MFEEIIDMLSEAMEHIDNARTELENTQPVIHQDLIELKWKNILHEQPEHDQKVIVITKDGCMYFLSYPYSHEKHPYWWPMPTIPENEP